MSANSMHLMFGALITVLCGGLGLLLLFDYVVSNLVAGASRFWPSVQGQIVSSQITHSTSTSHGHSSTTYEPKVQYTYTVNGTAYQGHNIGFGVTVSGPRDEAEQALKPYPVGAACTVYYGPKNPAVSVLERKVVNKGWTLFFTILMLAMGAGALIYTVHLLGYI